MCELADAFCCVAIKKNKIAMRGKIEWPRKLNHGEREGPKRGNVPAARRSQRQWRLGQKRPKRPKRQAPQPDVGCYNSPTIILDKSKVFAEGGIERIGGNPEGQMVVVNA